MKHTIMDLWNGSIAPCEQCGAHDPEINDLLALMRRSKEAICQSASPQLKEYLEKYIDCSEEYVIRMTEHAFCDGFSLAGRLITKAFGK